MVLLHRGCFLFFGTHRLPRDPCAAAEKEFWRPERVALHWKSPRRLEIWSLLSYAHIDTNIVIALDLVYIYICMCMCICICKRICVCVCNCIHVHVFLLRASSIQKGTQYKLTNLASQNHCNRETKFKQNGRLVNPNLSWHRLQCDLCLVGGTPVTRFFPGRIRYNYNCKNVVMVVYV